MRLRSTPLLDSFCGMDLKLGELSTLLYGLVKQLVRYIDPLARYRALNDARRSDVGLAVCAAEQGRRVLRHARRHPQRRSGVEPAPRPVDDVPLLDRQSRRVHLGTPEDQRGPSVPPVLRHALLSNGKGLDQVLQEAYRAAI